MSEDIIYGPFFDEDFFFYYDKTTLELELLKIYETDAGFIGFNHLERIHALGKKGSFDNVMFSGRITLKKTSYLCEGGLRKLLQQAQRHNPTMDVYQLQKACKRDKITVQIVCQLALMPVCYLTNTPAHSILIYSKNQNNINNQRRYIVKTFHIVCFRRSELTLRRYYILKFVMDTCKLYSNEVPREERDVHWLVKVYVEDYSAVFNKHDRPTLHRSEIYDHFATHAEWLKKVFARKSLVDRGKWAEWVDEAKRLKKKAKRTGSKWGSSMTKPVAPLQRLRSFSLDSNVELYMDPEYHDVILDVPSSEPEPSERHSSESESESDDDDVHYAHNPSLQSRLHRGLLSPVPPPIWHWNCDIDKHCPFVINIGSSRRREAPCMEPLSEQEKDYIMKGTWGLHQKRLIRIWKKMCQAHMEWHWRQAGLVVDHERRLIYGVEEEEQRGLEDENSD